MKTLNDFEKNKLNNPKFIFGGDASIDEGGETEKKKRKLKGQGTPALPED